MAMIQDTTIRFQTSPTDKATAFQAVENLFQALNHSGIRYCHWKSNLRLEWGMQGRTDLDLLVDPAHAQVFKQVLAEHHIKAFLAPPGKRYPALEDYMGFDPSSGKFFHLHVHNQLVLGEQFVKNYQLPLEGQFLDSIQLKSGVKIPAPELELIVLSIRALLKYRDRDAIKDILSIRSPGIPAHIMGEINWLLNQTCLKKVSETLNSVSDPIPPDPILDFLNTMIMTPRAGYRLYRLRQSVRKAIRVYQRHNRLWASITYFKEFWRRRKSFLKLTPERKMTNPRGGLTLALVGVDGSGKTTISRELATWLDWKLDVHTYYLGSKQPSWMSERSYLLFRIARRSHRSVSKLLGENNFISRLIEALRQALLYSHYLLTGYDRYRRYLAGKRNAQTGSIILFDRYPLEAPLDGPQIHLAGENDPWRFADTFSRLERKLYQEIQMPDLLFVLEVSPEVSLERKPDHDWAAIEAKNIALGKLATLIEAAPKKVGVSYINASLPLDIVLGQIKQKIWEAL